jgi:hypothetical protein
VDAFPDRYLRDITELVHNYLHDSRVITA